MTTQRWIDKYDNEVSDAILALKQRGADASTLGRIRNTLGIAAVGTMSAGASSAGASSAAASSAAASSAVASSAPSIGTSSSVAAAKVAGASLLKIKVAALNMKIAAAGVVAVTATVGAGVALNSQRDARGVESSYAAMDEHGAVEHGAVEHGAVEHGAVEHGAVEHGAVEHGAVEDAQSDATNAKNIKASDRDSTTAAVEKSASSDALQTSSELAQAQPSRAAPKEIKQPHMQPTHVDRHHAGAKHDIQDEVRLISDAHRTLTVSPNDALRHLKDHEHRYPMGRLVEERERLAIETLSKLGRRHEARRRAARFIARWPQSLYQGRIKTFLSGSVEEKE